MKESDLSISMGKITGHIENGYIISMLPINITAKVSISLKRTGPRSLTITADCSQLKALLDHIGKVIATNVQE